MSLAVPDAPRVLIADDQSDVLDALRLLLRPEGIHIVAVQSPAAVLAALREREFDVLLMDLNYARDTTSGREGLDLLSQVKALDPALPVVVMTGWATLDIAVEALRHGVRDFVQKPWENERVLASVRQQAVERQMARRQAAQHEREMEEARQIQFALLPQSLPVLAGWDIAAVCEPAECVGGDTFDLIEIDATRVGISLGDVSGKGIPAALLASNLQAAVRAAAARALPPARLCAEVNRGLCASIAPGHYITYFYGVLDTITGELRYCNAGHLPPLLIASGCKVTRLCTGGMVLGISKEESYEEGTVRLAPGDRLVVYTDGLTETFSARDEEYGEGRLSAALLAAPGVSSGRSVIDAVLADVRRFSDGRQDDDQTIVTVGRRDPG